MWVIQNIDYYYFLIPKLWVCLGLVGAIISFRCNNKTHDIEEVLACILGCTFLGPLAILAVVNWSKTAATLTKHR